MAGGWGCRDEGFMDFRAQLIGQGQDVFEKALSDPESLVDIVDFGQEIQWEDLLYIAMHAYELSTHKDMETMLSTRRFKPWPELKGTSAKDEEE